MASTIGERLRVAREAKGLSVEDVAHETRIHANSVRALEADNYSQFASITYAKSFLQMYSRFLGVDASDAVSIFENSVGGSLHRGSGFEEVYETIEPLSPLPGHPDRRIQRKRSKPQGAGGTPILLGLVVLVLVIAMPVFYFLGYKAENPDAVADEIKKNAQKTIDSIKSRPENSESEEKSDEDTPPTSTVADTALAQVSKGNQGSAESTQTANGVSARGAGEGDQVDSTEESATQSETESAASSESLRATPIVAKPIVVEETPEGSGDETEG